MKHLVNMAGVVVVGILMELGFKFIEAATLRRYVSGIGENQTVESWVSVWSTCAMYCTVAALATFLIWYVAAQFVMRVDYTGSSSKRPVWIILAIIPVIVAEACVLSLPAATSYAWLADLLLFFNALFAYWLVSAAFSPTLVKFDPVFSKRVRSLRDSLIG